jgi:hypothetical protein
MSNPHEIGHKVQDQTLDAVRKTQDAVVEAVTTWTETANKAPTSDDFRYHLPRARMVTKQFPTVAEIIDSNFDFAQRVLSAQRDFAHRNIAATTPKGAEPPKAKATAPKAVEAPAAAAKKSAPAKAGTAAKKASAAR